MRLYPPSPTGKCVDLVGSDEERRGYVEAYIRGFKSMIRYIGLIDDLAADLPFHFNIRYFRGNLLDFQRLLDHVRRLLHAMKGFSFLIILILE